MTWFPSEARWGWIAELAGKIALVIFFGSGATHKTLAIASLLRQWQTIEVATRWTYLAAHVCGLAFLVLIIGMTIVRYPPLRSAEGLEPRLSALAGTFLAGALSLLPPVSIAPAVTIAAVGLSALGALLSSYVLLWLGRSFSIMAQARKLVTSGPYRVVRHPLYCAEALMALGLTLLVLSPAAVAILLVQAAFQLRRMFNEERVLRTQFTDYEDYAERVPMLIPRLFVRHRERSLP